MHNALAQIQTHNRKVDNESKRNTEFVGFERVKYNFRRLFPFTAVNACTFLVSLCPPCSSLLLVLKQVRTFVEKNTFFSFDMHFIDRESYKYTKCKDDQKTFNCPFCSFRRNPFQFIRRTRAFEIRIFLDTFPSK